MATRTCRRITGIDMTSIEARRILNGIKVLAADVRGSNDESKQQGKPYCSGPGSTRSRSPTSRTPTAQVNALLAGQADAMTDLPFAQVNVAKSHAGTRC